jgi:crotonobetainyl-CoA:carnitine CoA-transferase CaiB-like acyl-CoA transferase
MRIIDRADIFLTGFRLDALERLGLDYAAVAARNSRIIYATFNGYGHRGPDGCVPATIMRRHGRARV